MMVITWLLTRTTVEGDFLIFIKSSIFSYSNHTEEVAELIQKYDFPDCPSLETFIHKCLKKYKEVGEWFTLKDDDLKHMQETIQIFIDSHKKIYTKGNKLFYGNLKKEKKIADNLNAIKDNNDPNILPSLISAMKYVCHKCDFESDNKANYSKHMESDKHKQLERKYIELMQLFNKQKSSDGDSEKYPCDHCDKWYSTSSNLLRHNKTCFEKKTIVQQHEMEIAELKKDYELKFFEINTENLSLKRENKHLEDKVNFMLSYKK